MIPRRIHRIWLGSELPAEHEQQWEAWGALFPDYKRITWGEEELAELALHPSFATARTYAERSDIARLRILDRFGGIYTDVDTEPLVRFDDLWCDDDRLVFFEQSAGVIWNGLIAAAPGAMSFVASLIERNAVRYPEAGPPVRTGPFAVSAAIDYQRSRDPRGLRIYPPAFLDLDGSGPHAVARTRFRDPPSWAPAPDGSGSVGRRDLLLELRLLPLRARRRLRSRD